MEQRPCFLCGTKCDSNLDNEWQDIRFYSCPACGIFGITRRLEMNIASDQSSRTKSAMLASERRVRNKKPFVLTDGQSTMRNDIPWINLDELLLNFPKSTYEMIERSLLNLAAQTAHPSDKITISTADSFLFFSKDTDGLFYILRQMSQMGWINTPSVLPGPITIEVKGWQKVYELTRNLNKSLNQAFIAMWFDESMNDVYEKGIRPAVEKTQKIKCVRIDLLEHNNKICDQIIAEIKRSRYLIADFTGNRGGVYFEAGFAQGLGLPVIWIVDKQGLKDVHFDTRQYNYIVYESPEDLYKKLLNRIAATITED